MSNFFFLLLAFCKIIIISHVLLLPEVYPVIPPSSTPLKVYVFLQYSEFLQWFFCCPIKSIIFLNFSYKNQIPQKIKVSQLAIKKLWDFYRTKKNRSGGRVPFLSVSVTDFKKIASVSASGGGGGMLGGASESPPVSNFEKNMEMFRKNLLCVIFQLS